MGELVRFMIDDDEVRLAAVVGAEDQVVLV